MLAILTNRTYRHLFASQVIALIGTGLMTVALGLLAFEIAGERAGAVLGTALAIKMIAYVGFAPIAGSFAGHVRRRPFLAAMDLVRAPIAIALPFVTQVWQIYLLIFLLQAASAAFTPTFQATIRMCSRMSATTPAPCPCPALPTTSRTCSVPPWRLRC